MKKIFTASFLLITSIIYLQNMQDDKTSANPLPSCIFWIGDYNFQAILNGTTGSLGGTSKFVDCVDDRHSSGTCAIAADNANCHQNDTCVTNGN